MKKLFVSLPMRDRSEDEIRIEQLKYKHMAECMLGEEVELIETFIVDDPSSLDDIKSVELFYLGEVISLLSTADYIIFANDWYKARGCHIEYECAKAYGIPIL